MGKNTALDFRPFVSVVLLVFTLFSLVFLKMEVRRTGYSVWRATQEFKSHQDKNRLIKMELAQQIRPDRIRKLALSKLPLSEAKTGQIIQLDGQTIAIRQ